MYNVQTCIHYNTFIYSARNEEILQFICVEGISSDSLLSYFLYSTKQIEIHLSGPISFHFARSITFLQNYRRHKLPRIFEFTNSVVKFAVV